MEFVSCIMLSTKGWELYVEGDCEDIFIISDKDSNMKQVTIDYLLKNDVLGLVHFGDKIIVHSMSLCEAVLLSGIDYKHVTLASNNYSILENLYEVRGDDYRFYCSCTDEILFRNNDEGTNLARLILSDAATLEPDGRYSVDIRIKKNVGMSQTYKAMFYVDKNILAKCQLIGG